jgi:transposase, IS5 family
MFRGFCVLLGIKTKNTRMQSTIFSTEITNSSKIHFFKSTDLGRIHATLPWEQLSACILDKKKKDHRGAKSYLSKAGILGLMFLKHYTQLSDEKLVARLNTDYAAQLFCGRLFDIDEQIRDTGFVSRIRKELAERMDKEAFQRVLAQYWSKDIALDMVGALVDATCYESHIEYPTDVKLLYEAIVWVRARITHYSKQYNFHSCYKRYENVGKKYLSYARSKRKAKRKTKEMQGLLLNLLAQGISRLKYLLESVKYEGFTLCMRNRFSVLERMYEQQNQMYTRKEKSIEKRIVSLHKPYVRPIVRGKETKSVEFGMKVNKISVGGLNFVDNIDFEAFNECNRLKSSVELCEKLFGSCAFIAGDRIYATNENRKFCTEKGIKNNFVRKGRGKDEQATKELKLRLSKERSTRLEGSFGNEKEHYGLRKIKAKNEENEKIWLLFGIHAANAVYISELRKKKEKQEKKREKSKPGKQLQIKESA